MASSAMATDPISKEEKEIDFELLFSHVRIYKDGSMEQLVEFPNMPPSLDPEDPQSGGVSSKDITISPDVSARLFLPKPTQPNQKFAILVYFHGGGFVVGSPSVFFFHRYLTALVSQVQVLAVSVDYRLAPKHLLPTAFEDCWAALQWVASHHNHNSGSELEKEKTEPWILEHGDFNGGLFISGDSAGGTIAHNMAMRAGVESLKGDVKIMGAFLACPYFWSSKPIGTEPVENREQAVGTKLWKYVYPSAALGIDNPMINPAASSLAGLGCSRLFVLVADKDDLWERGAWYYNLVKESGWKGDQLELYEVEGEGHCFHIVDLESQKAKDLMKRLASFFTK